MAGQPEIEQKRLVLDLVRTTAATVLGHSNPDAVAVDRGFLASGFDSLTAVEFRNRLNSVTGLRLPATVLLDHPTPAVLTTYLHSRLAPAAAAPATPLLAGIDALRAAMSTTAVNDDEHTEIATGIQELLRTWNGIRIALRADDAANDDPAGGLPGGVGNDLGSATDDELFAALDNELGRR